MYTRGKKIKTIKNYSLEETIEVLKENDVELLKKIIENRPEIVNEKDQGGNSLLHYATIENNKEAIESLLDEGADIEARNYFSATPLQIATLKVNLNLIKFLIERGARLEVFDTNNNLLFDNNSEEGREMIKYLLNNCISISLPISFISEDDFSKSIIFLSKDIFSKSAYEKVKKEWEIKQGKIGIQEPSSPRIMEIETISEKDKEELFEAVEERDIKLVRKIISNVKERSIDINSIRSDSGGTLLHYAAGESNLEMLKFLVGEGCDINASDKYGWTVLHSMASGIAERGGSWQIVEWFLQHEKLDIYAKTITDFEVKDVFAKVDYSLVEHYEKLVRDYRFRSSTVSISK